MLQRGNGGNFQVLHLLLRLNGMTCAYRFNSSCPLSMIGCLDIAVCGQALNNKGFADTEVAEGIPVAASALTALINKQHDGYSYLPVP